MTREAPCGIMLDQDGGVSLHYERNQIPRRLLLMKVDENNALWIKVPKTQELLRIGTLARVGGLLVLVLELIN